MGGSLGTGSMAGNPEAWTAAGGQRWARRAIRADRVVIRDAGWSSLRRIPVLAPLLRLSRHGGCGWHMADRRLSDDRARVHRVRATVGAGWWRRVGWVAHDPVFDVVLSLSADGAELRGCSGSPGCTSVSAWTEAELRQAWGDR